MQYRNFMLQKLRELTFFTEQTYPLKVLLINIYMTASTFSFIESKYDVFM